MIRQTMIRQTMIRQTVPPVRWRLYPDRRYGLGGMP
jgi:hypothetical protein